MASSPSTCNYVASSSGVLDGHHIARDLLDQFPTQINMVNTVGGNSTTTVAAPAATDRLMLSLCDGMGGAFLSLKADGFARHGITSCIAVEKDAAARKVCQAANPKTSDFPGVQHGLFGKHDIFEITKADFEALRDEYGPDALDLICLGPECKDQTKLRLLPDRPEYTGPKRKAGVDPRPGFNGKYGKTIRHCLLILTWALEIFPRCHYFFENVEFKD
ncbi:MAG: hypothetical protein VX683_07480, partial [Cyanobacteriota bacterium]|nr:hypothetical protein [Cyanobacteriota bacterium]